MAEIVKMPKLTYTMTEGILTKWYKKVGDKVKSGDLLAEVETDKVTFELDSYQDGILLFIGVEKGAVVPIDTLIAIIGKQGEDYRAVLTDSAPNLQNTLTQKSENYSYDLNYFFNADNIPNQELVFDTYAFFDNGYGEKFYSPIDFLNLLLWKFNFIKDNVKKPFDVLNNLKGTPIGEIEKHILFAFILKWFGGYPINNLDSQFNTTLKLIEREYLSYFKENQIQLDKKLFRLKEESPVNSNRIVDYLVEEREYLDLKSFFNSLDNITKGQSKIENPILINDLFNRREKQTNIIAKAQSPTDLYIFISHSSKDKKIVGAFIDKVLKLCLKIESNQIFCTSFEESTIKSGNDFRQAIKENLLKSSLVILIITENYKNSEVCLNEMGAAWALTNKVVSFILPPITYSSVGFIHEPNQLLKLNQRTDILKFIDEEKDESSRIKIGEINRHVDEFLEVAQNQPLTLKKSTPMSEIITVNELDLKENDLVSLENRDSYYVFLNEKLIHIADDSAFSFYVYGFNKQYTKTLKFLDVKHLIDPDHSIPVLHCCKIVIDSSTRKKWLVVNDERRSLPDSVYSVLVKKTPQPQIDHLSHQEIMSIPEGDKLYDTTNRFA